MNRSEISKCVWRKRKREGGKGKCEFCGKPIYSGGRMYKFKKYHATCLAAVQAGLSKKQMGISNPRPPARWWSGTWAMAAASYPRKPRESLKHWKKDIDKITGGIWRNLPEATRDKLIKRYDVARVGSALNPAKSSLTTFKCNFCGKVFKKVIGPKTYDIQCPKCKEYDVEVISYVPPVLLRRNLATFMCPYCGTVFSIGMGIPFVKCPKCGRKLRNPLGGVS